MKLFDFAGLLKDGGKHFSGVDEARKREGHGCRVH
jgi:hypothetical protein